MPISRAKVVTVLQHCLRKITKGLRFGQLLHISSIGSKEKWSNGQEISQIYENRYDYHILKRPLFSTIVLINKHLVCKSLKCFRLNNDSYLVSLVFHFRWFRWIFCQPVLPDRSLLTVLVSCRSTSPERRKQKYQNKNTSDKYKPVL